MEKQRRREEDNECEVVVFMILKPKVTFAYSARKQTTVLDMTERDT